MANHITWHLPDSLSWPSFESNKPTLIDLPRIN